MKYICYNAWIYPSDCFLLKCRATERGKDRDLLSAGPKDLNHSPMLSCAHQQGTRLEEEPPGPNLCALGPGMAERGIACCGTTFTLVY